MHRNRILVTVVAGLLLAGACGGDDPDPTGQVEGTSSDATAPASQGTDDPSPTDEAEEAVSTEAEAPNPDTGDTTEAATIEPEPEPEAPSTLNGAVELGGRFPWCATVNAIWQDFDEAAELLDTVNMGLQEAQQAVATATDELDAIEARNNEQLAQGAYDEISEVYDEAYFELRNYVLTTRLHSVFPEIRNVILDEMESLIEYEVWESLSTTRNADELYDYHLERGLNDYFSRLDLFTSSAYVTAYGRYPHSGVEPLDESELVAASRGWTAFDSVAGDVTTFNRYASNAGRRHALDVYSKLNYPNISEYFKTLREDFELAAEMDDQAIMALFIDNHEARAAYQKSYQESCQE